MRLFLLITLLAAMSGLTAQTTSTFEEFGLETGEFLNQAADETGFHNGHIRLINDYNAMYNSWSGWAISATTDTETEGWMNQFSSISGEGYNGSTTYAVAYDAAGQGSWMHFTNEASGGYAEGMYINNSTYAFLSMMNGDGFAKKFGGETGDDPDFFYLTIQPYYNGNADPNKAIQFYLADYRFEDNSQDYIINEWTYLDLSSMQDADSLHFTLSSSDVGANGMNTPGYFCIDDFTTADMSTVSTETPLFSWKATIAPNPTADVLRVEFPTDTALDLIIFDALGRQIEHLEAVRGNQEISLRHLPAGMYHLYYFNKEGWGNESFMKID